MKTFFFTLGCKVNQYETVILKNLFLKQNFEIAESLKEADIFIINSCTVTSTTDRKINKIINRIKNLNKNSIIVLTGCSVQAFPEKSKNLNNIDIIIGNSNKFEIIDLVKKFLKEKKKTVAIKDHYEKEKLTSFEIEKIFKKPRAFLKIQDGCNRFCTYCIIPKARGFLRSKPTDLIEKESIFFSQKGCCEIILVGINLSLYGKDLKNTTLMDAIKTVSLIKSVKRIRLSSLEPNILTKNDLIYLSEEEKFCPHFHFSLQSGCDKTLKNMGRHYDKKAYMETVDFIFKKFKNPAITTDIIVGFPGETKEDFEESLNFIKEIEFSKVHVFPYSKRNGTKAAIMPNQIPKEEKKARAREMIEIAKETTKKFLKSQKDKILSVLFETKKEDILNGYSKNYILVKTKSKENLQGEIKNVLIKEVKDGFVVGELIN